MWKYTTLPPRPTRRTVPRTCENDANSGVSKFSHSREFHTSTWLGNWFQNAQDLPLSKNDTLPLVTLVRMHRICHWVRERSVSKYLESAPSPINQSHQPSNQPAKQANQPTNQPANQPNQVTRQPTLSQPDNLPTRQPAKHRFLFPWGGLPVGIYRKYIEIYRKYIGIYRNI